jgi:putative selenium metabolism protein SsnA
MKRGDPMKLLIKNAAVLQYHPPLRMDGMDILIEGDSISEVSEHIGYAPQEKNADRVIDAQGRLAVCGNVCSHTHFYSALARGILAHVPPSKDFVSILKNLWWRLDRALDEQSLYYSGLAGAFDAIRCGTTAVVDHSASPSFIHGSLSVLKQAFERFGLRGILCYEVTDRNGKQGRDSGIEENLGFIHRQETKLLRGAVGAHASFTLCDETLEALAEAVGALKRGIHIHAAEDVYDQSYSRAHFGLSTVERLERFGLIDDLSLVIHGVHLDETDVNILNDHGSFLVHNPRSNMNNRVGYNSMLSRIQNVAIGTDGIGADMFEETTIGYFKSMDAGSELSPADFLRFLCNGNTILERYFGSKFGKVAPGYRADLVLLDYEPPTPLVTQNIGGHFVFGLSSGNVDTVIINGSCVYEHRRFPFDTEPILRDARKQAQRLWEKMEEYL